MDEKKSMPKGWLVLVLLLFAPPGCWSQTQAESAGTTAQTVKPVLRPPFTLTLELQDGRAYTQEVAGGVPYVHDGNVFIFDGEHFGVDAVSESGTITRLSYRADPDQADLVVALSHERQEDGKVRSHLTLLNRLEGAVRMKAFLTRPEKAEVYPAHILPVPPATRDRTVWPYPVAQVVLRNLLLVQVPSPGAEAETRGDPG
jgi:hypothetical protein